MQNMPCQIAYRKLIIKRKLKQWQLPFPATKCSTTKTNL